MKYILIVKLHENSPKHLGPFETYDKARDAARRSTTYCNDEREIEWTDIQPLLLPETKNESRHSLIKLLESHDWYYHYSDDNRVWRSGIAQWKEIERFKDLVEDFDELVEEHRPKAGS